MFVVGMELVAGKWLTISGVSYLFPLPFSYMVIAAIAYYVPGWRHLQVAVTLSAAPFLLLWWSVHSASPTNISRISYQKCFQILDK